MFIMTLDYLKGVLQERMVTIVYLMMMLSLPNYLNHSVLKAAMMELNGGNIFNG